MDNLIRTDKVGGIRNIIFAIFNQTENGEFDTKCVLGQSKNTDSYSYSNIGYTDIKHVIPKVGYEYFERTENPSEANLLVINYFHGTDTKDIISYEGDTTFVVDDKVPVMYRLPNELEERKGRVNSILNYIGLDHIEKPEDKKGWDTDMYTKIQLLSECKYRLYKLIKRVEITAK